MSKKAIIRILFSAVVLSFFTFNTIYAQQPGKSQSSKSIKVLLNEIEMTGDAQEKSKILRQLEGKKPVTKEDEEAVINALDSSDLEVQEKAVKIAASAKIKGASKKLLQKVKEIPKKQIEKISPEQEKEYRIKSMSALALSEMKDKNALPVIIDILGESPPHGAFDESLLAISAVNYGKDALPLIEKKIEEYGRKNPYGKMRLLSIIMNTKDKNAVPKLKEMFDSDDPDIKSAAARGLRNLGETVEIAKILKTLKESENKLKKVLADPNRASKEDDVIENSIYRLIDELGYSGNPDAIPFLKARIEQEKDRYSWDPSIYSEALALARIGGEDNFNYLLDIYHNVENDRIRGMIISVFGNGKMLEAIPFLTEIISDKNVEKQLRLYGTDSLGQITGEKEKYMKIRWEIEDGKR